MGNFIRRTDKQGGGWAWGGGPVGGGHNHYYHRGRAHFDLSTGYPLVLIFG